MKAEDVLFKLGNELCEKGHCPDAFNLLKPFSVNIDECRGECEKCWKTALEKITAEDI